MTQRPTPTEGLPRYLLAIHEDSNANATLFRDGVPIFAVAEERLSRLKFAAGFPTRSVQACLDFAGISLQDVDVVVPGNKHHFLPRISGDLLPEEEHDYFGPRHKAWLLLQDRMSRGGLVSRVSERVGRHMLQRRFARLAPLVDHHTAHAYSAALTSGFDPCLVVTADNMGDGWSSKVFSYAAGRCAFLWGSTALHSPGQFYGEITQLLGFHNLMAGKVTGLAAHGDPRPAYGIMQELFALDDAGTGFVTPSLLTRRRRGGAFARLAAMPREQVAAAAQKRLEDVMVQYVRHACRETGLRDVVAAGGTFANVVVNQKILGLDEVSRVYVHPAMTDQGISMGAGLAHLAERCGAATTAHMAGLNAPLSNIYLGPGYDEAALGEALEEAGCRYERCGDIAGRTAALLAEGQVVARFDGRLEYGPRALGNRSLLYRADDPSVNDWLNGHLRRTEFMPFAPATLQDHAAGCYEDLAGGELAARYMTITFRVSEAMRRRSPGVVHLDGTARPQLVREADNPGYHAVLEAFHRRTGVPSIINTSFNMHGEPIVCSPQDAIRAFRAGRLPYMAMGPFLVVGEPLRAVLPPLQRAEDAGQGAGAGSGPAGESAG